MCTACCALRVHCMYTAYALLRTGAVCTACILRAQGPCAENQLVLARSCVCENVMPLLEFLLALQLSGGQGAGRSAKEQRQGWAGHEPLRMAQLLEAAMCRAEDATGRDTVAKFARTLEPYPYP